MSEEAPKEILEGADLCLCCLEPVRPGASRCVKCGAPQDFIGCTLPFLQVLAEGFVYHRAVQQPRSWLSVAGIWVIFGQLVIGGLALLWMIFDFGVAPVGLVGLTYIVPSFVNMLIGFAGIVICTKNYATYCRSLRRPL